MADSLRSQPRRLRAARRAAMPAVRVRRPAPERHHPASASDVRTVLASLGEEVYYGLKLVELRPAPPSEDRLQLASLVAPGHILLYDQPPSPWRLSFALRPQEQARLAQAGADIREPGVVIWPNGTLRDFMLRDVLLHELGHHILQHERRRRGVRAARTTDHEARAEAIAASLRARLK